MLSFRAFYVVCVWFFVQILAQENSQEQQQCISPKEIVSYETQVFKLQQTQEQLETKWQEENNQKLTLKKELEEYKTKATLQIQNLENQFQITKEQLDQQSKESKEQLDQQSKESKELLDQKSTEWKEKEMTLQKQIEVLQQDKNNLLKEQQKLTDKIQSLENEIQKSIQKNQVLTEEIQSLDEKFTMTHLLSSYYDLGMEYMEKGIQKTRHQLDLLMNRTSPQKTTQIQAIVTRMYTWTYQKYQQHLASTCDPFFEKIMEVLRPQMTKYQPIIEAQVVHTKSIGMKLYQISLRKAKNVRIQAIQMVQEFNPKLAPYAQKIVDALLGFFALPLVLITVRLLLRLLVWSVWTFFYLALCCFCCGRCGRGGTRRVKVKRVKAPTVQKRKKQAAATTTNGRRSSGKRSS